MRSWTSRRRLQQANMSKVREIMHWCHYNSVLTPVSSRGFNSGFWEDHLQYRCNQVWLFMQTGSATLQTPPPHYAGQRSSMGHKILQWAFTRIFLQWLENGVVFRRRSFLARCFFHHLRVVKVSSFYNVVSLPIKNRLKVHKREPGSWNLENVGFWHVIKESGINYFKSGVLPPWYVDCKQRPIIKGALNKKFFSFKEVLLKTAQQMCEPR